MDAVDEVVAVFDEHGDEFHGEQVDQRRHGLQCATHALAADADDTLVAAALLHDIGHLLSAADVGDRVDLAVDDDRHEAVGARWLAPRFDTRVSRAVALHVVAKRYRCAIDPPYRDALSPASVLTLQAQGGLLDASACDRFAAHPGFEDAMALRAWDEAAKDVAAVTGGLESFLPVLRRCART